MKKLFLLFAAFTLLTLNQAFAYRATDFSSDTKIIAALNMLESAGETDVLRNLQKQDRKSTRLNSSHIATSRMPSSA